jgi:hypothetical protein
MSKRASLVKLSAVVHIDRGVEIKGRAVSKNVPQVRLTGKRLSL